MSAEDLGPKQRAALAMFAQGCTIAEVSDRLDISKNTLARWRTKHPVFAAELAAWAEANLTAALGDLTAAGQSAVAALVDIAGDKEQAAAERRAAAIEILDRIGVSRVKQGADEPPPALHALLAELSDRARLDSPEAGHRQLAIPEVEPRGKTLAEIFSAEEPDA